MDESCGLDDAKSLRLNVRRRSILKLLAVSLVVSKTQVAFSQSGKTIARVAWYGGENYEKEIVDTFKARMGELGWIDGRNAVIRLFPLSVPGAASRAQRRQDAVQEVLKWKPDVIVTSGTLEALALKQATAKVPVCFWWVEDPVGSGLVSSLSRPGGNITGAMTSEAILGPKRLEIARELLPLARRIAVVFSEENGAGLAKALSVMDEEAKRLEFDLQKVQLRPGAHVSEMISGLHVSRAQAVIPLGILSFCCTPSDVPGQLREMLDYQAKAKSPFIDNSIESVDAGFFMALAESDRNQLRRVADLVAKILRGTATMTLPVDQAMRIELHLNQRAARSLGIDIPASILARADRVIG